MSKHVAVGRARRPGFFRRLSTHGRPAKLLVVSAAVALASSMAIIGPATHAAAACANPVVCENALPGTPESVWQMTPGNGATITGFADPFSVNVGNTVNFKIRSPATSYAIDIYRVGYYGGDGARLVTSLTPNITASQNQPACNTNTATGLVDCGNWGISASWAVPSNAVSGVYFAHIHRTDGVSDDNEIMFVVTNTASTSNVVYMTNDQTLEAYNDWGGYSLYTGNATATQNSPMNAGRAVSVSYNRPFSTTEGSGSGISIPASQGFFYWDYPMIRWLEENGYDVSYVSQEDVSAPTGATMLEKHKVFMTVGHSEYWDAAARTNVTAARNAGVNLAFFAGNLMWWKTRWAASQFGSENFRTIVTYKESLDSAQTDPSDPPTWTGSWRDPRFSPPADGGQPENALTGQLWEVNCCAYALQVPSAYSKLRFWRNTSVAGLSSGQTATMPPETLGVEWDSDVDNGFRPAGEIDMSKTTQNVSQLLLTPTQQFGPGTATNSLTLYRAASGALVFDAGSYQWSWGLDSDHLGDSQNPPSQDMQQATVNLFADMGAQPGSLQAGLTAATASTDRTAPTSAIASPSAGQTFTNGNSVTVSGTATDSGGGVVAGVEVSTDGGSTWHPVTTMSPAGTSVTWSYTWTAQGAGTVKIESRATDDSGNIETPGAGVSVTVGCPCSLLGNNYTPSVAVSSDTTPLELGVKFSSSVSGFVTGVRFYKGSANTGTHTGELWTASGTQLATGTFTNETASGWQTLTFTNPVAISANTTYIASYYDPNGHYTIEPDYFDWGLNSPPLSAPKANYATAGGGNGVYNVGGPGFPTSTYAGSNFAVDVLFNTSATVTKGAPPSVASATPFAGSSSNPVSTAPSATFSEAVVPSSVAFSVKNPGGTSVAGSLSFGSGNTVATFTPTAALAANTTYTVAISGAQDSFGQTMAAPFTYSFTTSRSFGSPGCPCTVWPDVLPPGSNDAADTSPVELGVTFKASANGFVSGIRFYKESDNTGTHTGTLWSSTGTKLATGTFASESTQGWQELDFTSPVAITAGTTYVASYHTNTGHYANLPNGLASSVTNGPLSVQARGGVFAYGSTSTFPSSSFNASNYWVDVVYTGGPAAGPTVTSTSPIAGQSSVSTSTGVSFTFSAGVQPSTVQFALTGPGNVAVPGALTYDSSTNTDTFVPTSTLIGQPALSPSTTYTATVSAAQDTSGNPMASPFSWSFTTAQAAGGTCPCSIWPDSTQPNVPSPPDTSAVNLGVRFTSDTSGFITGIRFYKGPNDTGTHVGSLWSATGTLLGQVTFTGETSQGWEQANFATPVAITANTTYVASYFAPNGGYAGNQNAFTSSVDNPPLHALQSTASNPNGLYLYGGSPAFPSNSYLAANYWVDVVFNTTAH